MIILKGESEQFALFSILLLHSPHKLLLDHCTSAMDRPLLGRSDWILAAVSMLPTALILASAGGQPGDDVGAVAKVATCVPNTLGSSSFRVHQVSVMCACICICVCSVHTLLRVTLPCRDISLYS